MRTSKFALAGTIAGIILMIVGALVIGIIIKQYYYAFPDKDKFLGYLLIGVLCITNGLTLIGMCFNYNQNLKQDGKITNIDDRFEEIIKYEEE